MDRRTPSITPMALTPSVRFAVDFLCNLFYNKSTTNLKRWSLSQSYIALYIKLDSLSVINS